MDVIVGTAGHIDHGKTALIKALTGTDTDRLPEEKKRGITIDLGFAELRLGEHEIGFVDVPGHERFVKNMLAGASGIDLVLLIIAADEGVMPQTREHFDICRLLGVANGLVVVTKADLVDEEMLDLVRLEAAELTQKSFLADAPLIAVSSKTGAGIEELKQALLEAAGNISERPPSMVTRLPIDRSFTVKGFGAVVTGTLASGSIGRADELELMPLGKQVRVRGLQTHGQDADSIGAGHRVAVNLAGVDHVEIERGMTLCEAGTLRATQMIDTRVEVLQNAPRPLRSRQRVRLHIGTAEILARVHVIDAEGEIKPGDAGLVQLRPEAEIVVVPGERFILRSYSPQATIAGGEVIDNFPRKHRKRDAENAREFLNKLVAARSDRAETVELIIDAAGGKGMTIPDLQARTGWKRNVIETAIAESGERLVAASEVYITQSNFEALKQKMLDTVGEHHKREPLSEGITREALRESVFAHKPVDVFKAVIATAERERLVTATRDLVRAASHSQTFTDDETRFVAALTEIYKTAGLEVPKLDEAVGQADAGTKISRDTERKLVHFMTNSGVIIKAADDLYFAAPAVNALIRKLKEYADHTNDRSIDVAKFKEIAGVSRKYAIPLLEYLDRQKVTVRTGDRRSIS